MFSWIANAIGWAQGKISGTIVAWVHVLVNGIYGVFHTVSSLVKDAWTLFYGAVHLFAELLDDFGKAVGEAFHYLLDVWIPAFTHWIDVKILKPLERAWDWINKEGAYMWHLLTHAPDLVDFLWDALLAKLEAEAWTAGKTLGKFFLSLVIHHVKEFAQLLEDIADAIL